MLHLMFGGPAHGCAGRLGEAANRMEGRGKPAIVADSPGKGKIGRTSHSGRPLP